MLRSNSINLSAGRLKGKVRRARTDANGAGGGVFLSNSSYEYLRLPLLRQVASSFSVRSEQNRIRDSGLDDSPEFLACVASIVPRFSALRRLASGFSEN